VCVCVCACVCDAGVAGCRSGPETGSSQAAGHQQHPHGLAVRQMQQDLLITDWALRPSAGDPSVTQSVVFDGALHVCDDMPVNWRRRRFTNCLLLCWLGLVEA